MGTPILSMKVNYNYVQLTSIIETWGEVLCDTSKSSSGEGVIVLAFNDVALRNLFEHLGLDKNLVNNRGCEFMINLYDGHATYFAQHKFVPFVCCFG